MPDLINTVFTVGPVALTAGVFIKRWLKAKLPASTGAEAGVGDSVDVKDDLYADLESRLRYHRLVVDDTISTDRDKQTTVYSGDDLRPVKKPQLATATPVPVGQRQSNVMSLADVVRYLNDAIDQVPHWFCVGGTGSGKSTFIRMILAYRIARGERFIILTGKRTKVFADIPCIGIDPMSDNDETFDITYFQIARACRQILRELRRRDQTPIEERNFPVINIVIDDASLILSELEIAHTMFRNVGLLGRELNMRLIVATGSLLVKELGLEGKSDLRDHFAVVRYNKKVDGSRENTLRPRYDDTENIPFDSRQVPSLSSESYINAEMVWSPDRLDKKLLQNIHSGWDQSGSVSAVGDSNVVDQSSTIADDDDDNIIIITRDARHDGPYSHQKRDNNNNNSGNNNSVTLSKYNQALTMLIDGKPQSDIAMQLGMSPNAVNAISKVLKKGKEAE